MIRILDKYRKEAAKALAEVGLTPEDVSDFTASVGEYGVGVCGCLPEEITSALSGEENVLSKELDTDDERDRAWIAAEILALCRFAFAESNHTDGPSMLKVGERLAEAGAALHDPEKRREYIRKWNQRAGRKKRGAVGPLKQTLRAIGSFEDLLALMADEDALDDFNASAPPHPCKLTDIEDGRLWYIVRRTGIEKSVTIEHVKRIFRYELNK